MKQVTCHAKSAITKPQNAKGLRGERGRGLGGGLGGGGMGRGHREAEQLGDPLQLVLALLEDLDDRSRSRFGQENEPGRTEMAVVTAAGRRRRRLCRGGGAGSTRATWRRLLALLLGDEVHLVHEAEDLRRLRVLTHRSEACAREREMGRERRPRASPRAAVRAPRRPVAAHARGRVLT